jgi:hypothetical protein
MRVLEMIKNNVVRKTVLGAALMAGFLAFLGAGSASASPRVFIGIGGPVVVGGYYAPAPYWRPVYVVPRYRAYYVYGHRYRFWDARLHRWCYR